MPLGGWGMPWLWLGYLAVFFRCGATSPQDDHGCWTGELTPHLCCNSRYGPEGNQRCFNDNFTYDVCCHNSLNKVSVEVSRVHYFGSCWIGDLKDFCCDQRQGVTGNPMCFDELFTYDVCCNNSLDEVRLQVSRVLSRVQDLRSCWSGDFTEDFCCDQSQGVKGNPMCFDENFTYDFCCHHTLWRTREQSLGSCWVGGHTEEFCCDQKHGVEGNPICWDSEFEFTHERCCQMTPRKLQHAQQTKYFFSVLVMIRDESAHILEFVRHYLEEGADHIYIVDDRSVDDYQEALRCVPHHSFSIYTVNMSGEAQDSLYQTILPMIRPETTWLAVVDVDEFISSRGFPALTIRELLTTRAADACASIAVPWIMYAWGNFNETPRSVRDMLTWRWGLNKEHIRNISSGKFRDRDAESGTEVKSISQLSNVTGLFMHAPAVTAGSQLCHVGFRSIKHVHKLDVMTYGIDESNVDALALAVHHYRVRSWQHFRMRLNPDRRAAWKYIAIANGMNSSANLSGNSSANRMDVVDEYMTKVRAPARKENRFQIQADATLRSCDS
eukprot:gb/GFBE01062269.1/.p1 GENE.gb/GFBE01062269.1/~~gb/GFBE01062269.1/.p1  ORF type:complete len:553 (+),score=58.60 gb/GFBE01062269.1/:1-1659(+)